MFKQTDRFVVFEFKDGKFAGRILAQCKTCSNTLFLNRTKKETLPNDCSFCFGDTLFSNDDVAMAGSMN